VDNIKIDLREMEWGGMDSITIRMIKSKTLKLAEYVARTGGKINICKVLVGTPAGKAQVDNQGVDVSEDNIKKVFKVGSVMSGFGIAQSYRNCLEGPGSITDNAIFFSSLHLPD
jgi:hypothetical protein